MRMLVSTTVIALGILLASGCSPTSPAETAKQAEAPTATPASDAGARPPITLPVSINAVMVALVDHASEPLWLDAYEAPTTEARWLETEYNAYQLAVVGKLIQLAGTGPKDAGWVADPEWIVMSDELSAAGMDALNAAKARNVAMLNTAGDRLVATLHVEGVREAGGHAMVTTRSEIATTDGEPVCTATSTIVVRGEEQ